jgi:hypothetical protein
MADGDTPTTAPLDRDELIKALESFRSVPTRPLTLEQQNLIAWHENLTAALAGPNPAGP